MQFLCAGCNIVVTEFGNVTVKQRPKESERYENKQDTFYDSFEEDFTVVEDYDLYTGAGGFSDSKMMPADESLKRRLEHMDKTFQEHLFWLIDHRGLTDPQVYKKANIDRKHFSKIRSDINYSPSKKTALALAIALELNMDETIDLLKRAGLALSPSIKSDKIISYCIEHGNYDIYEINNILFAYDQPTLGV